MALTSEGNMDQSLRLTGDEYTRLLALKPILDKATEFSMNASSLITSCRKNESAHQYRSPMIVHASGMPCRRALKPQQGP